MKHTKEKYYYSPETGMKLLISEELDERMKEDLFPEKTAKAKEILSKIDLSQLKAVGRKK